MASLRLHPGHIGPGQARKNNTTQTGNLQTHFFNFIRASAQDDGFQAVVVVEVDVGGAEYMHKAVMLDLVQAVFQIALVVVVANGQHPVNIFIITGPGFLNQLFPDEIADQFTSRVVPFMDNASIDFIQQWTRQTDGESAGIIYAHGNLLVPIVGVVVAVLNLSALMPVTMSVHQIGLQEDAIILSQLEDIAVIE